MLNIIKAYVDGLTGRIEIHAQATERDAKGVLSQGPLEVLGIEFPLLIKTHHAENTAVTHATLTQAVKQWLATEHHQRMLDRKHALEQAVVAVNSLKGQMLFDASPNTANIVNTANMGDTTSGASASTDPTKDHV